MGLVLAVSAGVGILAAAIDAKRQAERNAKTRQAFKDVAIREGLSLINSHMRTGLMVRPEMAIETEADKKGAQSDKIYISVFNTDASSRAEPIKPIDKLCEFLIEKVKSHIKQSGVNFIQFTAEHEIQAALTLFRMARMYDEEPQTQDDFEDDLMAENYSFGGEDEDPEKMAVEILSRMKEMPVEDFDFEKSCLITLSEFTKTAALVLQGLLAAYKFVGHQFTKTDYLACFWSPNWNYIDHKVSEEGKCLAVVLEDQRTKNRIVYLSVHLPHKTHDKKKAPNSLLKLAKELQNRYHPDETVIAGDFNMNPSKIRDIFNQLSASDYTKNMGIVSDNTETTKKGRSIDNVLMKTISAQSATLKFVNVDKDDPSYLTHYPLYGVLQLNRQGNESEEFGL